MTAINRGQNVLSLTLTIVVRYGTLMSMQAEFRGEIFWIDMNTI